METYEVDELFIAISGVDNTFSRLSKPKDDDDRLKRDVKREQWFQILSSVPLDDALKVIVDHYQATSEPITPDRIYQAWERKAREQFQQAQFEDYRRKPKASAEQSKSGYMRAAAALAAARGWDPQKYAGQIEHRRQLMDVKCPFCRALPGKACRRPIGSSGARDGASQELRKGGFHPSRWKEAGLEAPQPTYESWND